MGRRADAVCIVVAEHGDQPARTAHGGELADKFAHPAHQKGGKEVLARGREKAARLFGRVDAARKQDARRDFVQPAGSGDRAGGFALRGR